MEQAVPSRRRTGRPLSFDPDAALGSAMLLFWRHGFEATSVADLTRAMGVSPPSLYAAFGDKKGLFRAAVRRYAGRPQTALALIAGAPSARDAARLLLEGSAKAFTGDTTPAGCLLASAAIAVSAENDDIRAELASLRHEIRSALRDRIAAEHVASGATPAGLATYVMTVIQGLSTMARDGSSRAALIEVARLAMTVWPDEAGRTDTRSD